MAIGSKTQINVIMVAVSSALDEVVVIGYGTQKKINLTGSVETVKFGDAVTEPVTNTAQLMYGKFSGVQITQSSGLPGADESSIVIRGVGSFGSTSPLIVIDNIQYDDMVAFNNLSPSDIESISVLKDASASAIYGARGANGVVVVTTKQGKKGIFDIIYNGYTGHQKATVVPQYLDALNYATLFNEASVNSVPSNPPSPRYPDYAIQLIKDGSQPDHYANTNWANTVLKNAPIQNQYLSFSGGTDKTTFRASISYLDQQAIVQGKFRNKRYTLGLNLNSKVKDWLNLSNVTNVFWNIGLGPNGGSAAITGQNGIINQFQRSQPTVPVYYSNGNYGSIDSSNALGSPIIFNPIRLGFSGDNRVDQINIAERFGIKINLTKNLSFETSGSANIVTSLTTNIISKENNYSFNGSVIANPITANSLAKYTVFNYKLSNENILRYSKKIHRDHDVSVLLGHSLIYTKTESYNASASGFPVANPQVFDLGYTTNPQANGTAAEVAIQSFFSRVNYAYKGKYLFEVNVRRDGSSRFGPDNLYGTFPSASVGWRVINEKFMDKIKWVSELKLRGSWGITGNDNIGNYLYQQTYNSNNYYSIGTSDPNAVYVNILANPLIQWENVKQLDFGMDAGFFKNKLTVTVDYFKRNSYNLLYQQFAPPYTIGFTSLVANVASMVNQGVEFSANYRNKIGKINYNIGGSISWSADNKVTSLGSGISTTIVGNNIIQVGSPYLAYYGYKTLGIFQTQAEVDAAPNQKAVYKLTSPGDPQFADVSGPKGVPDGIVDANDRTIIGNPYPKYTYNMIGSVDFKMFDFKFTFNGVQRVDRLLNSNGQTPLNGDRDNALAYWVNRWTPTNPSTTLPKVNLTGFPTNSSFYIQDCSYLRLKNIEFGISIPQKSLKKLGFVNSVRLYVGGQNLVTFTKLKNFDPERSAASATDNLTPLYKVYTFGLNIKF